MWVKIWPLSLANRKFLSARHEQFKPFPRSTVGAAPVARDLPRSQRFLHAPEPQISRSRFGIGVVAGQPRLGCRTLTNVRACRNAVERLRRRRNSYHWTERSGD